MISRCPSVPATSVVPPVAGSTGTRPPRTSRARKMSSANLFVNTPSTRPVSSSRSPSHSSVVPPVAGSHGHTPTADVTGAAHVERRTGRSYTPSTRPVSDSMAPASTLVGRTAVAGSTGERPPRTSRARRRRAGANPSTITPSTRPLSSSRSPSIPAATVVPPVAGSTGTRPPPDVAGTKRRARVVVVENGYCRCSCSTRAPRRRRRHPSFSCASSSTAARSAAPQRASARCRYPQIPISQLLKHVLGAAGALVASSRSLNLGARSARRSPLASAPQARPLASHLSFNLLNKPPRRRRRRPSSCTLLSRPRPPRAARLLRGEAAAPRLLVPHASSSS
jgi:hypothetical protein